MSDSPNVHYATPDPEYAALFASLPPSEFPSDIQEGRKLIDGFTSILKEQLKPQLPDGAYTVSKSFSSILINLLHVESKYKTTDHSVPVAEGAATILIRTITPTSSGASGTFPVFYWIHGGGGSGCRLKIDV